MDNYKFRSELVKGVLPTGVTDTSHVKREEVSGILDSIKGASNNVDYILMFVICRIDDEAGWNEGSITTRLSDIRSDINALKGRLVTERGVDDGGEVK